MKTWEDSEVTVRSKAGVEYRQNSFFVKRYNPPDEAKKSTENANQEAVSPTHTSRPLEESAATSGP